MTQVDESTWDDAPSCWLQHALPSRCVHLGVDRQTAALCLSASQKSKEQSSCLPPPSPTPHLSSGPAGPQ